MSASRLFSNAPACAGCALALVMLMPTPSQAQDRCEPPAARVVSLQGAVELRLAGTDVWTPATLGEPLCFGDALRVGRASRAALALANDSTLRLDERTTLQLRGVAEERRSLLDLLLGSVYFFSHRPRALEVDTPFINAAAEGTEFLVRVGADRAEVVMLDGRVLLRNPQGELRVASGDAALIPEGEAPRPMVVARPRDAVAWALYYPPILAELAGRDPRARPLPPGLQEAVERVAANDYAGALDALEAVPEAARDARYHTYRAGVLLNVGRVEEADAAIAKALALDPEAGEALAQRAIIHVVQNREAEALGDARRALELSPDSAAAAIALSYALQAAFQLEEAREVLRAAVERSPEDALAWTRLAELEQMFGNLGASRDAAEQAVALAPDLARTQMVLGFAALTRIDIDGARAAFERAIELDSANPLPRLGLGLAKIRRSDLAEGRHEIEIAAALDPNDALIRSYLGKAYFEEKRDPLDAEQFAIAKQLDPNDPTPWFYDAIRLQTENRPVEALRSLERSIELNDNRAVYRSRLLLDEDLGTRQVSLARIYNNLGFEQLGLNEATKSLGLDPTNYSAHRFLSDTYAEIPRHEIARASELLQSQLLQPINLNPVQPSLSHTDLNVVAAAGPAEAAFNEFTPLFTRNDTQLTTTGVVGNNDTYGGEGVLSMLYDRTSLSVGGSALDTSGFRNNNDDTTKLADAYGQVAATPKLSLQAEYRYRETDGGDIPFNFDPDVFSDQRENVKQNTERFGARFALSPNSDVLASFIYSDRTDDVTAVFPDINLDARLEQTGYQLEAQYLLNTRPINVTAGLGTYDIDSDQNTTLDFTPSFGVQCPTDFISCDFRSDFKQEQQNAYIYTDLIFVPNLVMTLGMSAESVEIGRFDQSRINPKIGLQWNPIEDVQIRLSALTGIKRPLVVDQTLEPTQVAGFNQFFDDFTGTKFERYGIGVDTRLAEGLYGGAEVSKRNLKALIFEPQSLTTSFEDWDDYLYRAYLYWTLTSRWTLATSFQLETFERETGGDQFSPNQVETIGIPIRLRYFDTSGFFAGVRATYVHQDVSRPGASELEGNESFAVVDASLGYRIPRRWGIATVGISNLLDTKFRFQDANFRTSETRRPEFIPERTIFARLVLSF